MKVRFGSIWLAPGVVECAAGFSINGQQVNDPVQFYRAANTSFFPRGLRSDSISFTCTRQFSDIVSAERFVAQHFSDLDQQNSLYLFLGYADDQIVRYDNAVLDSVQRSYEGTSVTLQYALSAGLAITDSPPPTVVEPDSTMIKRALTAIGSGATTLAVTFGVPFSGTPVVVPVIQIPSGGDFIFAVVRDGTVSTTGFTVDLSAPTPNANYKLSWVASA